MVLLVNNEGTDAEKDTSADIFLFAEVPMLLIKLQAFGIEVVCHVCQTISKAVAIKNSRTGCILRKLGKSNLLIAADAGAGYRLDPFIERLADTRKSKKSFKNTGIIEAGFLGRLWAAYEAMADDLAIVDPSLPRGLHLNAIMKGFVVHSFTKDSKRPTHSVAAEANLYKRVVAPHVGSALTNELLFSQYRGFPETSSPFLTPLEKQQLSAISSILLSGIGSFVASLCLFHYHGGFTMHFMTVVSFIASLAVMFAEFFLYYGLLFS